MWEDPSQQKKTKRRKAEAGAVASETVRRSETMLVRSRYGLRTAFRFFCSRE